MTDKLFTQETPASPDGSDQQPDGAAPVEQGIDPNKPLFKVGEREYNAEQAAKDIAHKQAFIDQLLKEKRELEEKAAQGANLDAKLQQALEQLNQQRIQAESNIPSQETTTVDQAELMEQLRKIAEQTASETYERSSKEKLKQENLARSIQAAKEVYGTEYQTKLAEKGKALGLTPEQIESMAQDNPLLFVETLAKKVQPTPAPQATHTGYRSFKDSNRELKIPRITGYFSPERRVQALREAEKALSEAIANGTYKART